MSLLRPRKKLSNNQSQNHRHTILCLCLGLDSLRKFKMNISMLGYLLIVGIRFHVCKSVPSYASKWTKQINFKIRNRILSDWLQYYWIRAFWGSWLLKSKHKNPTYFNNFNLYLYILKVNKIEVCGFAAEPWRAKRACGAPWVSKATHPRKFGNHVTVHRPPVRPHHRETSV